jgi:ATP-dependent phosphoenolpyruvate carboxykinase
VDRKRANRRFVHTHAGPALSWRTCLSIQFLRNLDLNGAALIENTRGARPLDSIANLLPPELAGRHRDVILLAWDTGGVTPPMARPTPD